MNVIILAGGLESRIAGLWDKPKCLIPYKGLPLLAHHLHRLERVLPVPDRIVVSVFKRPEVIRGWLDETRWGKRVSVIADGDEPLGTAGALRYVCITQGLSGPLLVFNGDTLITFSLRHFLNHALHAANSVVAATNNDTFAGCCMIQAHDLPDLLNTHHKNLDTYLAEAERHTVESFLDVGTPEGFNSPERQCDDYN